MFLITLEQPILSVMQIAEFGRQIIYGVIVAMLLLQRPRQQAALTDRIAPIDHQHFAGDIG